MDHLGRNLNRGFAGDENDAPPAALLHPRKVVPAQPDTAHNIHFEEPEPVIIGNLLEWLRFENPEIVHQDVDLWKTPDRFLDARPGSQIRGQAIGAPQGAVQFTDRIFHSLRGSPVDDNLRAFSSQRLGNGKSNSSCRAGDQGSLSLKFQVHIALDAAAWPKLRRFRTNGEYHFFMTPPAFDSINRRQLSGLLAALASQARRLHAATNGSGQIDDTLRGGIAQRKIPAAVAMAASADKVLYSGAFGTRDSSGAPVTADSIFAIASMTKAITTTAAMQLVEQGKVKLDAPVATYLPQLKNLQVLDGFDSAGKPQLRPAKTQVTLRHLLTHTSGICYDTWEPNMFRYTRQLGGRPPLVPPLMFEPGTRWQYGMGVDWAGRLVEAISAMTLEDYFQAHICGPLGMHDTSYLVPASKFDRLVTGYSRQSDGSLKQDQRVMPPAPKEFNGGGGLYSTTGDYIRFMQMILRKGRGVNEAYILDPKTVASMEVNQIGAATAGKMKTMRPENSADVDIQPGQTEKWGLGFLINTTAYPGGRSAGSLAWAGIFNTFYWIDPKRSMCAVIMMQFLPFVDKQAVGLLGDFERAVYSAL